MHDLDRTQLELFDEFEDEYYDEYEYEDEFEDEYYDEYEYEDEFEDEYYDEYESEYAEEEMLDDEMEHELAMELLQVEDEEEMEQFIGSIIGAVTPLVKRALPTIVRGATKLFSGRGRSRRRPSRRPRPPRRHSRMHTRRTPGSGQFLRSPAGQMLRRDLKNLAGRLGSKYGWKFGRWAAGRLGLEMESEWSSYEMEYEAARKFIKIATSAAQRTMLAPAKAPSKAVVKKAIKKAIKKHAKSMAYKKAGSLSLNGKAARGGKWIRKGDKIVLLKA